MNYPLIAARVFERPLLIERRKLNAILGVLGPRMGFELPDGVKRKAWDDDDDNYVVSGPEPFKLDRGIARIQIIGSLVHRGMGMNGWSGLTSYEELTASFRAALADDRAKSILFEIDSGGGEADGVFDLADEIYAARGAKPMVAIAKDGACSAAYLIASACDRVVVTQTGEVGSVGVISVLKDRSKQNEMLGVAVTYIHAGDHKTDGWPDIPLSDAARQRFQADIDQTYQLFVGKVAKFRGKAAREVIATEALTYVGNSAVAIGFADEVTTIDAVLKSLADEAQPPADPDIGPEPADDADNQEIGMTSQPSPAATTAAVTPPAPQPAVPPAPAVDTAALERQAASATKKRIGDILGLEEAKGREDLAHHIAFETELSVEQAKAMLGKAEAKGPAKPADRLDAAMRGTNPQVGADNGGGGSADDQEAERLAKSVVATIRPSRAA